MLLRISFLLIAVLFSGCTQDVKNLPDERTYIADSTLLIKTSEKFSNETDIKKLHEVAKAMEFARTLNCVDFNNECTLFSEFLAMTVRSSAKGTLTAEERRSLQEKATEIRSSVEEGKRKLSFEWAKQKKQ